MINRGTFTRTWIIDDYITKFIEQGSCQIVSLGSGSDTRPFRMAHVIQIDPSPIYYAILNWISCL